MSSNNIRVSSISLSHNNITIEAGEKFYDLSASIHPVYATNKALSWRSNNPAVADVKNAIITAKSNGNAIITATSTDGSNIFHTKANHRQPVCDKVIESLEE